MNSLLRLLRRSVGMPQENVSKETQENQTPAERAKAMGEYRENLTGFDSADEKDD